VPYPVVPVYKGHGSTDEAANFVCRDPDDRDRTINLTAERFWVGNGWKTDPA